MHFTPYPDINQLLDSLLAYLQSVLGAKLVGLYLYGSLVGGDFDSNVSDIDLLAATATDVDPAMFDALKGMQDAFILNHPRWENRLDIAYLSVDGLKTFKIHPSKMAFISPGEPFHIREAADDWLRNWYLVREMGVTLFGPLPTTLIAPISKAEFVQAVKVFLASCREWADDTPVRQSWHSYVILMMCRGLYACKTGTQLSKVQAALWAEQELPAWSPLIKQALLWRQLWSEQGTDPPIAVPETRRFVNFVLDQALSQT